jgi:phage major head subunit gpT-like protein
MIVNASNLAVLTTNVSTAFKDGQGVAETSFVEKIATKVPSTSKRTSYAWLGQFPRLQRWVGSRVFKNLQQHDYTIKNEKFEATVAIAKDDIEDDSYGVYSPLFKEMGYASKIFPDELGYALMLSGFTQPCFDGLPFWSAAHPVGNTTYSNVRTGSGPAWFLMDTRRPLKPFIFQERSMFAIKAQVDPMSDRVFDRDEYAYGIDGRCNVGFGFPAMAVASNDVLTQATFDEAYSAIMGRVSDEGHKLGFKPSLLVVGSKNRSAALETVVVARQAGGADNPNHNAVEVLLSPFLD